VSGLFDMPATPEPDEPLVKMTAASVKTALRGRHPSDNNTGGLVGQWTCIEEWRNVDLLALNAWRKADVIGYEVKVSRSDMRGELLRPAKRVMGVAMTTEFYFAVPAGLLTAAEIAWEEPEWEPGDFERVACPGVPEFGTPEQDRAPGRRQRWGGECYRAHYGEAKGRHCVPAPIPEVFEIPSWNQPREGEDAQAHAIRVIGARFRYRDDEHRVPCWKCGGKGYLERSRVEREAPTLWVPRDVGLVTVNARGCRVVKTAPKRKTPEPIAATRRQVNDLVRWVSHRPDRRHRTGLATAALPVQDDAPPPEERAA
jgi:hypothetical protein